MLAYSCFEYLSEITKGGSNPELSQCKGASPDTCPMVCKRLSLKRSGRPKVDQERPLGIKVGLVHRYGFPMSDLYSPSL